VSDRDLAAENATLRQELAERDAALDRVRALAAAFQPGWGIREDLLAAAEVRPVDGGS
jgi:hypothetical protein